MNFFATSEQTPTIVALGVLANEDGTCKQSGGFIIQLLPNASKEAYDFLDDLLKNLKSVSNLISNAQSSDKLIDMLNVDYELLFEYPICYKCNCSLEKTKILLTQLTNEELLEDINKNQGLDVTCNFCQHTYHLNNDDLREVLEIKKQNKYQVK